MARSLSEVGIGFAFAPQFHPSYRHASVVRREIGGADGVQSARPADQSGLAEGRIDRLRLGGTWPR